MRPFTENFKIFSEGGINKIKSLMLFPIQYEFYNIGSKKHLKNKNQKTTFWLENLRNFKTTWELLWNTRSRNTKRKMQNWESLEKMVQKWSVKCEIITKMSQNAIEKMLQTNGYILFF